MQYRRVLKKKKRGGGSTAYKQNKRVTMQLQFKKESKMKYVLARQVLK